MANISFLKVFLVILAIWPLSTTSSRAADLGLALSSVLGAPRVEFLAEPFREAPARELLGQPSSSWRLLEEVQDQMDCSRPYWGRLTIQNPFPEPLAVVLVDRWLLTRLLDLYGTAPSGQESVLVSGYKGYGESYSVPLRHVRWRMVPGVNQLVFRYQCLVRARPSLQVLSDNEFSKEASFKVMIWSAFCMAMFFSAVYGLVFFLFTRNSIDLALSFVSFMCFLAFFLLIRIEGRVAAVLPNLIEVDLWTYLLTTLLLYMAVCNYIRIKLVASGRAEWLSRIVLPSFGVMAVVFLLGDPVSVIIHATWFSPLAFGLAAIVTYRSSQYFEAAASAIMTAVHLYLVAVIQDERWLTGFSFWFLPVGYFATLLVALVDRGYHGLEEFRQKNGLILQKRQNQIALRTARELQSRMLTESSKSDSFASFYQPAESLGGDWFSYFQSHDGRYVNIFVGDITGHGIASAYVTSIVWGAMVTVRHIIGAMPLSPTERIVRAARLLNRIVYQACARHDRSMTAVMITIDLLEKRAYYFNGGHSPVLHGSQGRSTAILAPGMLIGYEPEIQPRVREFTVKPGDLLLLYTDGLLDLRSPGGEKLKIRELSSMVARSTSAARLCSDIRGKIDEICVQQPLVKDDVTVLIYQVAGGTAA